MFASQKQNSYNIPILWNEHPFEIVNKWKYLGLNLNRLPNKTNHLKKPKIAANVRQTKIRRFCSDKHLNKYMINKRIYKSLVKSGFIYAMPTWAWATNTLKEINIIQNKYFRHLFLLLMTTLAPLSLFHYDRKMLK